MQESHYHKQALAFATDLVNTPLRDLGDLEQRWRSSGLGFGTPTRPDMRDLAELRVFTAQWTSIIDAASLEDRVALLNEMLARAAAYPRITDHDGSGWHLHYRDDGVRMAGIVRAVAAVAGAEHLTRVGMNRLGRCALTECRHAFIDTSRGGRQRYCSRECANRDAVRRHRSRKSSQRSVP